MLLLLLLIVLIYQKQQCVFEYIVGCTTRRERSIEFYISWLLSTQTSKRASERDSEIMSNKMRAAWMFCSYLIECERFLRESLKREREREERRKRQGVRERNANETKAQGIKITIIIFIKLYYI